MKDKNVTEIKIRSKKQHMKKHINHVMRGVLLYKILILLVVVGDMIAKTVMVLVKQKA